MSAVAAVFMTDGGPADPGVLAAMLEVLGGRGPHGRTGWREGSVALGFLPFHATPESVTERQPHLDPRSGSVIAFDGRLDNRDELVDSLEGAVSNRDGDAAFAAAAFDRWDTEAP